MKERWLSEESKTDLLSYVSTFKKRLSQTCKLARTHLTNAQSCMKVWCDRKARQRQFNVGDQVLALMPELGHYLRAKSNGLYRVEHRIGAVDYVINTSDRRKSIQLVHINMLKKYARENDRVKYVAMAALVSSDSDSLPETTSESMTGSSFKLNNSACLDTLVTSKLNHLNSKQQQDIVNLVNEFKELVLDVPSKTNVVHHDVDVGNASPIKQSPYRVRPDKRVAFDKEIKYMKDNGIIENSYSSCSSPCLLVSKQDSSFRFVTDFQKVNTVTKTDSFPVPRVDDCIDRVGQAKLLSEFDLLKGYWQAPLTERVKEISAFVTPDGLFRYRVMPMMKVDRG